MAYEDKFRISTHAVITDDNQKVLLLKQTYTDKHWGLPGGSPEKVETIQQTLKRECLEELGCEIEIKYLSGVYFHKKYNSYAFIFRCELKPDACIKLSKEHSEYRYFASEDMTASQRTRVEHCLNYDGEVKSEIF
jgi:8-oxo-dGTP diphosphatase